MFADEDIAVAMTQDLPAIAVPRDPRLRGAPASAGGGGPKRGGGEEAAASSVEMRAKRLRDEIRRRPDPPLTQFGHLVRSDQMQLSYIYEGKCSKDHAASEDYSAINSIDFAADGNMLVASTGDDTIVVLDLAHESRVRVTINPVKKYGANLIKMLAYHTAVHASTKTDNDLRLLDLVKHTYIRYYKGHTGQVCSLDVTPSCRTMVSAAAVEKKVYLWDVDQLKPMASLKVSAGAPTVRQWTGFNFGADVAPPRTIAFPQPVVACDANSSVFAVAVRESPEFLLLYDLRNYDKGPFMSRTYNLVDRVFEQFSRCKSLEAKRCAVTALSSDFTDLKFSPDGSLLLLNTNGPYFYLLDAMTGRLKVTILRQNRAYVKPSQGVRAPEVSFSPDSEYVIGGNGYPSDPRIYCWSVRTGRIVGILNRTAQCKSDNLNFAMNYVRHSPVAHVVAAAGGQRISLYKPEKVSSNEKREGHSAPSLQQQQGPMVTAEAESVAVMYDYNENDDDDDEDDEDPIAF